MIESEHHSMADTNRAERFKTAVLDSGTYEEIAEKTGISISTLVRICSGKTDPKLSDAITIAKVTGQNLNDIIYGDTKEQQIDAIRSYVRALDGTDEETDESYRSIIWNLSKIYKVDLQSLAIQIQALSKHREQQWKKVKDKLLKEYIELLADDNQNNAISKSKKQVLIELYDFTEAELDSKNLELEILAEKKKQESKRIEKQQVNNEHSGGFVSKIIKLDAIEEKCKNNSHNSNE